MRDSYHPTQIPFLKSKRKEILFSNINLLLLVVNLRFPSKNNRQCANVDGIREYAKEVVTLTLLYYEFDDAIKEGDGQCVFQVWKFLLLIFKAGNRKNYSSEALTLLCQYHFLLSPRLAQQLLQSRFINTHGWPGHNIPCDLHMEHVYRPCKTAVSNLKGMVAPVVEKSPYSHAQQRQFPPLFWHCGLWQSEHRSKLYTKLVGGKFSLPPPAGYD